MSYRPLPDYLTIKDSSINGLGLFATEKIKSDEELFRQEESIDKSVKESQARKAKKPKGLKPKKKKARKQGNMK